MRNVDEYVRALERELRDQPRRVRRAEAADLREHLGELPPSALEGLPAPAIYAQEYRAQRDLRSGRVVGALRRTSIVTRIVFVVVVVVIAAAATIPPWVAHYQPVSMNVFFGSYGNVPQRSEHNATVLSYRDGAIIMLGMSVRNSGRFDATLTSYDDGPDAGVLKLAAARVMAPPKCCVWEQGRPVRFPLQIRAGTDVTLMLELRLANCEDYGSVGGANGGGGSVGYTALRFPMKTLGVHHLVIAPLEGDQSIYVDMPGPLTKYCPRNRTD